MSKYLLFFCLLLVCIRPGLQAQVTFELNPFEKAEPFKYQPIRSEFWNAFADKLKLNQIDEAVSAMSSESFKKLKDSEKAELYLALAESAEQTDHPYLAILLVSEITHIFPLSNQAIQSYFLLEDILKKYSIFDDLILGETIVEQDINLNSPKIPPEIRSFLGYVLFQSHRQQGFTKWEKQAQKWITPDSEWAYRLEYDRALYELFNDRFDNSLDIFQKLMDNEKASDYLRKKAKRQVARLIFEKGEFQKSFEMLKSLQFEQDDRGAILLERAWNKYYLKHYS